MENEQLLGCPFCGREPYVLEPAFPGDRYQVGCMCSDEDEEDSEQGSVWRDGDTLEDVTRLWNTRA